MTNVGTRSWLIRCRVRSVVKWRRVWTDVTFRWKW